MNAEEKVIHYIRRGLEDERGEEYAKLSEEQQNELILMVIREHIEQMRKEKRHR
jgi:hypothetical protein